jgi:hypothetical protein
VSVLKIKIPSKKSRQAAFRGGIEFRCKRVNVIDLKLFPYRRAFGIYPQVIKELKIVNALLKDFV